MRQMILTKTVVIRELHTFKVYKNQIHNTAAPIPCHSLARYEHCSIDEKYDSMANNTINSGSMKLWNYIWNIQMLCKQRQDLC